METKSRNLKKLLWALVVMLFTVQTVMGSAKAGDVSVMIDKSTSINLALVYQQTLSRSRVLSYQWRSENSTKVRVTSYTRNYAYVKGMQANTSCKVYFKCSYIIDGYYRTMDFYYNVTVKGNTVSVSSVTPSLSNVNLKVGASIQLTASVYPTNASNRRVTWSCTPTRVATVSSSGLVTAHGVGTAWVRCTAADGSGKYGLSKIVVSDDAVLVSDVSLNRQSVTLEVGKKFQLTASVTPSNASNKSVSWTSGNTQVATVSSTGLITAKGTGTTTIFCSAKDNSGKRTACSVTVKNVSTNTVVSYITLAAAYLQPGDSLQLNAVTSADANQQTQLTWTSSNPAVANVTANGVVTALAHGISVIICKSAQANAVEASFTVMVNSPSVAIQSKSAVLDKTSEEDQVVEVCLDAWSTSEPEDNILSGVIPSYRLEAGSIILSEVTDVAVYELSGKLIYHGTTDRIQGVSKGVYVLKLGETSEKISMP